MSPLIERAEVVGQELQDRAWTWYRETYPAADETTYRKVYASVQLVLLAAPEEDFEMAMAAIGAAVRSAVGTPCDTGLTKAFNAGFEAFAEAQTMLRGPMQ